MTREEEIKSEAKKHGLNCMSRVNYQDGFIEGAKWADKTMLDKACEWLEEKNKMCMCELEMILGANFINDFKRYLEK